MDILKVAREGIKGSFEQSVADVLGAPAELSDLARKAIIHGPKLSASQILVSDDPKYGSKWMKDKLFNSTNSLAETIGSFISPSTLVGGVGSKAMIVAAARIPRDKPVPNEFFDSDGIRKTALSDKNVVIKESNIPSGANSTDIQNVVDAPELYSLYPELKRLRVTSVTDPNFGGSYNSGNRTIKFNELMAKDPDQFKGLMLHEIQHAIQDFSVFKFGSSPQAEAGFDVTKVQRTVDEARKSSDKSVRDAAERLRVSANKKLSEAHIKYKNNPGEQEARFTQTFFDRNQQELNTIIGNFKANDITPQTWDTK